MNNSDCPELLYKLKYFKPEEFEACIPYCDMMECNVLSLQRLDKLRELCGFPLKLNSAFRSVPYELSMGRKGNSAHTRGRAFDIAITDSSQRYQLIENAFIVGFRRIGVHKNFIHVDDDPLLPQGVIWTYDY